MFSSFMIGAAAGYMYHDYMLSGNMRSHKGDTTADNTLGLMPGGAESEPGGGLLRAVQ